MSVPRSYFKSDKTLLTAFFKQDDDLPELEGEEKGDKKIQEIP
jgi:hypothetical protein